MKFNTRETISFNCDQIINIWTEHYHYPKLKNNKVNKILKIETHDYGELDKYYLFIINSEDYDRLSNELLNIINQQSKIELIVDEEEGNDERMVKCFVVNNIIQSK